MMSTICTVKTWVFGTAFLLALGSPLSSASAATYNFIKITNNATGDTGNVLGSIMEMDVQPAGSGAVSFTFKWDSTTEVDASLTSIYFDNQTPSLFAPPPLVTNSAGVSFTTPEANPPQLPGGNPGFVESAGESAGLDGESLGDGMNSIYESVMLTFTYAAIPAGIDFNDVLDALTAGTLRVGLHIQSIGTGGGSDSYINKPGSNDLIDIPIPGSAVLLLSGLLGLGAVARRRAKNPIV